MKLRSTLLSFVIPFIFSPNGWCLLPIPRGLSSADCLRALGILGHGTLVKPLGDPYPLGGYTGLEVGLSWEHLLTADIAKLGQQQVPEQDDTSYFVITMGKGLFYNVDFFLQFSPLGQSEQYSSFGGALRWGFYETTNWPVHFSLQIAGNSSNFQNLITTTNQEIDLFMGYSFVDISVYAGIGMVRSSGLFMGGSGGITDSNDTLSQAATVGHGLFGFSYRYRDLFAALEIDNVGSNVVSSKIGMRF
ncbi:MAG: hypothetical protein C5B49_11340 [Bdellovibrio sp.]|nr:MAG: hypothetical protein C5B49_11340 [Bdellovibrio sp.]